MSSKNSNSGLPWRLLAVEAVLVVSSVLLALALDSWLQSRSDNELARRAVQEFVNEAQKNCAHILAVQSYHESVVSGERKPEGMRVGLLRNDAWDVAKTIGAAQHIDPEIVASIVAISANQSDHRTIIQAYLQSLYTVVLQSEQQTDWHREGERGVISDLVRIQTDLIDRYRKLMTLLEVRYGSAIDTRGECVRT